MAKIPPPQTILGSRSKNKYALPANYSSRSAGVPKPSGPELVSYARYLGMDPVTDADLIWVAEEALTAPLPEYWSEHFDGEGRVYFYNRCSGESSWVHPLEAKYIQLYKILKVLQTRASSAALKLTPLDTSSTWSGVPSVDGNVEFTLGDMAAFLESSLGYPAAAFVGGSSSDLTIVIRATDWILFQAETEQEILQWTQHTDVTGHVYFYNHVSGASSWEDPKLKVYQKLISRMKLLVGIDDEPIRPQESSSPTLKKKKKKKKKKDDSEHEAEEVECIQEGKRERSESDVPSSKDRRNSGVVFQASKDDLKKLQSVSLNSTYSSDYLAKVIATGKAGVSRSHDSVLPAPGTCSSEEEEHERYEKPPKPARSSKRSSRENSVSRSADVGDSMPPMGFQRPQVVGLVRTAGKISHAVPFKAKRSDDPLDRTTDFGILNPSASVPSISVSGDDHRQGLNLKVRSHKLKDAASPMSPLSPNSPSSSSPSLASGVVLDSHKLDALRQEIKSLSQQVNSHDMKSLGHSPSAVLLGAPGSTGLSIPKPRKLLGSSASTPVLSPESLPRPSALKLKPLEGGPVFPSIRA